MRLDGFLHALERMNMKSAELAVPFQGAEHDRFANGAATGILALVSVLVLFLATDERLIDFDGPFQRAIERTSVGRMAQAMQHEPSSFLRDLDILRERRAGDPLLVRSDKPDRHEPLAERDFRVLEDGPDFDRKPLPTVAALVVPVIGEVVDLGRSAVRTMGTILPADRAQVINARLLVGEGFHHVEEAVELLDHGFGSDPIAII